MPLSDHFRSPPNDVHSWDELHGLWPAMIVQDLSEILPEPCCPAPGIHLGSLYEVDVAAYRKTRVDCEVDSEVDVESDRSNASVAAMATYDAVTMRVRGASPRSLMDNWYSPLAIGRPPPTLPIWLRGDFPISLALESSDEKACRTLQIRKGLFDRIVRFAARYDRQRAADSFNLAA